MAGWSLLAGAPYYVTHLVDPSAPYPGDAFAVTATFGVLLSLWGAGAVSQRLEGLQPTLAELLPDERDPGAMETVVLNGAAYRDEMFAFIRSGEGRE